MKNKVIFSRIVLFISAICISLIGYTVLDYRICSVSITPEGLILKQTNWMPVVIHLFFTIYLIFVTQYYYLLIWHKASDILKSISLDIKEAFIPTFKAAIEKGNYKPKFKISINGILLLVLVFAVALFQTYSLWDFYGEKVDENAIYHYAIGFFGGDFDPNWYGYGGLGMYLLYFIYILLYVPMYLIGMFNTLDEYAMQMFYNGYFVLVARYTFAVLGIIAVIMYAKLAKQLKIPLVLIVLFAIISFISKDAIHFANYLRTDYLVGFFVALTVYFAYNSHKKASLYLLAIAVAGAISAKISALPLILILGGYALYRLYDKTIKWPHLLGLLFTFIAFLYVFQPYVNHFERILGILNLGVSGRGGGDTLGSFNWGKSYQYALSGRLQAIYDVFVQYCSLPVLLSLPLLVFSRMYIKVIIPALSALLLLVIPYINSPEITYYWFTPAFNLTRFLSLVAFAGFYYSLHSLVARIKLFNPIRFKTVTMIIFVIMASIWMVWPQIKSYPDYYKWEESNKMIAQKWLEQNMLENSSLLIERNVNYNLPQLFDINNFNNAKRISRAFKHNRDDNDYLNRLFRKYLEDYYLHQISVEKVKEVKQIDPKNISPGQFDQLLGKYYITSPSTYNRYLNRQTKDLSDERRKQLEAYQNYYRYMISNPLYKRFNNGRGRIVEVYHLTNTYEDFLKSKSVLENKRVEIKLPQTIDLTKDITVRIDMKLNNFPANWTPIIDKFESDYKNEFSLRLRDDETGQLYFGTGEDAIIRSWNPLEVIPIGEWVSITFVRDTKAKTFALYVNDSVVASRGIPKGIQASFTESPVRIFGAPRRLINGQLGDVQIWNKVATSEEMKILKQIIDKGQKPIGLIGFWLFGNIDEKDKAVKDISGNNIDALIVID